MLGRLEGAPPARPVFTAQAEPLGRRAGRPMGEGSGRRGDGLARFLLQHHTHSDLTHQDVMMAVPHPAGIYFPVIQIIDHERCF